jgi:hypothetical protein
MVYIYTREKKNLDKSRQHVTVVNRSKSSDLSNDREQVKGKHEATKHHRIKHIACKN